MRSGRVSTAFWLLVAAIGHAAPVGAPAPVRVSGCGGSCIFPFFNRLTGTLEAGAGTIYSRPPPGYCRRRREEEGDTEGLSSVSSALAAEDAGLDGMNRTRRQFLLCCYLTRNGCYDCV